jgi:hypothetical protein
MSKKYFLGLVMLSFFLGLTSCKDTPATAQLKFPGEVDVEQMSAYYANTLPCKDCPGIYTEIQFYNDSSFLMYEVEILNDSIPTGTMGRWRLEGRVVIMDLPEGKERYLLYNGNDMLLLDSNQDVIEDDIKYAILRQPTMQIDTKRPFRSVGEFGTQGGIPYFMMCNVGATFPVMQTGPIKEALTLFEERDMEKLLFLDVVIHFDVKEIPDAELGANIYIVLDKITSKLDIEVCAD